MTPRIVFWCGRSLEPWYPGSLTTTGIGGSETAVVHIAQHFHDAGWRVDVFNGAERWEGEHNGVGYWDPERFRPNEKCDVFVSWRNPGAYRMPVGARAKLLWLHDLNQGPDAAADINAPEWSRVLGVSAWHARYLSQVYGVEADHVPNGIDLARFSEAKKVWGQCVYASSPDRNLERLLKLWPAIKGQEDVTLKIAYGWENLDKRIAGGDQGLAAMKANLTKLIEDTPGVEHLGRLNQKDLAKLYDESWAWLYPTSFLETSCISAMEAMAGGCVPVCSSVGALKDTVGDGGYVVTGHPESRVWPAFYVNCARAVLYEMNVHKIGEAKARERAKAFSWDASFERWQGIVAEALK